MDEFLRYLETYCPGDDAHSGIGDPRPLLERCGTCADIYQAHQKTLSSELNSVTRERDAHRDNYARKLEAERCLLLQVEALLEKYRNLIDAGWVMVNHQKDRHELSSCCNDVTPTPAYLLELALRGLGHVSDDERKKAGEILERLIAAAPVPVTDGQVPETYYWVDPACCEHKRLEKKPFLWGPPPWHPCPNCVYKPVPVAVNGSSAIERVCAGCWGEGSNAVGPHRKECADCGGTGKYIEKRVGSRSPYTPNTDYPGKPVTEKRLGTCETCKARPAEFRCLGQNPAIPERLWHKGHDSCWECDKGVGCAMIARSPRK